MKQQQTNVLAFEQEPDDPAGRHDPAQRLAAAELEYLRAPRGEPVKRRTCGEARAASPSAPACGHQASPGSGLGAEPTRLAAPLGAGPACAAYPLGNFRTNDNFIFLREILQAGQADVDPVEAGDCLRAWLAASVNNTPQPNGQYAGAAGSGVLVIDQLVELNQPIKIPSQFILSGVGKHGAGALRFRNIGPLVPAITFEPAYVNPMSGETQPSYASIQDIRIYHAGASTDNIGIGIDDVGDIAYLRRLYMWNWGRAIANNHGYSVVVEQCDFNSNRIHITLGTAANAMRVRECRFVGASARAMSLNLSGNVQGLPLANSCLITGSMFSANQVGVYVDRHLAATIVGNTFRDTVGSAIYVTRNARQARIIGNYFDGGDTFVFQEQNTANVVTMGKHQWGFNTVAGPLLPMDVARLEGLYVERIYTGAFNDL